MQGAVIVISSHVARGSVGNRAAVFALETLSVPVWAIPTITLPWHPGHSPATRIVPGDQEFSGFLSDIATAPWISEVEAVLSGYMANAAQVTEVATLVQKLKAENPDLRYLCDPVIGDVGGLYVTKATAEAIRDQLLPLADIATPNCHELAWLTESPAERSAADAVKAAQTLGVSTVLVTSCPGKTPNTLGNLLCHKQGTWLTSHDVLDGPPNGPGDLTAAIYLGHDMAGMEALETLEQTTASVLEILAQSAVRGSDELMLETDAASILKPSRTVRAEPFPSEQGSGRL